jgi:predicted PurR-regulated permease PerM
MLVVSLIGSIEAISVGMSSGGTQIPPPPLEVKDIPFAGGWLDSNWELASSNLQGFLDRYGTVLLGAGKWAIRPVETLGKDLIDILIAVLISGALFVPGRRFVPGIRRFAGRIVGGRGSEFVDLCAATIRNVARGVIGVAVVQSLLVGVALMAAGVPAAGLLTLAALIGAILQIGVGLVVVPVIAWAWFALGGMPAILLTAWLIPAMFSDLVLKPLMVGRGLRIPMLVILAGVIGGTISFGLIGLFLGPIVLALCYELVSFWVELGTREELAAESVAASQDQTAGRGGME